jgi:peptidylprolyl isomerase
LVAIKEKDMRLFALVLAVLALNVSPALAAKSSDAENTLILTLPTGDVVIEMYPAKAPKHVAQVKALTRAGFYDGLAWFRVIDGFMAQTGYPKGKKGGKSDMPDLPAEFGGKFKRGTVGMGHGEDPNSANSQFFVCFTDNGCKDLTGKYTAWGQVKSGMEHIDTLKRGEPPRNPDKTIRARIAADADKKSTLPAPSRAKTVGNQ